ncbi:MAG TPA: hypothetical protein VIK91_09560 [Nannocystis sp.]
MVKVGDVVAWCDVPDGAMVRPNSDARVYSMRINGGGRYVCNPRGVWRGFMDFPGTPWGWDPRLDEDPKRTPALIVALGLTGEESADDLRRLAEIFEVREALLAAAAGNQTAERTIEQHVVQEAADRGPTWGDLQDAFYAIAERLHAAGWRPGMTAEDAARMLSAHDAET